MTYFTKDKIDNLVEKISVHLTINDGGIVDGVKLASQSINYLISIGNIKTDERKECCEYVTLLFNLLFDNSMPYDHLILLQDEMLKVNSYNYSLINKFI